MTMLESIVSKLNFKKAIKVYIIFSFIAIILCGATTLFFAREKINMAFSYRSADHTFENTGLDNTLKNKLIKLSAFSNDIKNTIVVDKDNNIVYKTKDFLIDNNKTFILNNYGNLRNYLQDNINKNIVYKVTKDEDIILDRNYIEKHRQLENDINDQFSFENDMGTSKVYLLNYSLSRNGDYKLFIIRDVSPVPYLETMIKITGIIAGLIFIIYWIGLALWVFKDANKKDRNPSLWALLVLITNLVGLFVYIIYRQNSIVCNSCGQLQSRDSKFCSSCGSKINKTCDRCNNVVSPKDKYCNNCGNKL